MYRVDRNNFYQKEKPSTVYTPQKVSEFIFGIVGEKIDRSKPVFDPCVGAGSLLKPFKEHGFKVIGVDIKEQGFPGTKKQNYLEIKKKEYPEPSLVIMNPPFNIDVETREYIKKNYGGRPLLPELWFQKAIELFGKDIPIILFSPYGLRLNQQLHSKRWEKFTSGEYPEISGIISLPKDVFENVLFHSEILIFNIKGIKGHYFYNDEIQNESFSINGKF